MEIKKELGETTQINNKPEINNKSAEEAAKVHLHNEQDHIQWNSPEIKVEVHYEDVKKLNICKICQRRFCSEEELNNHLKQPTLTKNYSCCACGKVHKHPSNLNMHIRKHTGDKPYVCDICSKRFMSRGTLNIHKKIHTGEKQYECFDCGKKFIHLGYLSAHLRVHRKHNEIFKCNICSKVCSSYPGLKYHERVHKGPVVCEICKKSFSTVWTRNLHMKIHTDEKPFSCDSCKKVFRWRKSLWRHIKVCGRDSAPHSKMALASESCEMRFRTEGNLNRRVEIHSHEQFSCNTCKKDFRCEENFKRHICGENLAQSFSVKDHTVVPDKEKLEQDEHDITGNARKQEQNGHVCETCKKSFTTAWARKLHMKIHTGEKSFSCDTCKKAFRWRMSLRRHTKVCGRDSAPRLKMALVCEFCKMRFTTEGNLNRHMKIHSHEQFSCNTCRKDFRCEENFKRHICGKNLAQSFSVKDRSVVHDKEKLEQEEHYIRGDARNQEQGGHSLADYIESNDFMKVEPEEPQIVEVKIEQEDGYITEDVRKLEQNGQTIASHEETSDFIKVEPEDF